jgi:hypothetical protein
LNLRKYIKQYKILTNKRNDDILQI